jgi:hypothetical protein
MTPDPKLAKVFKLSAFANALFVHGLRKRFPGMTELEMRRILLARLQNKSQEEVRLGSAMHHAI